MYIGARQCKTLWLWSSIMKTLPGEWAVLGSSPYLQHCFVFHPITNANCSPGSKDENPVPYHLLPKDDLMTGCPLALFQSQLGIKRYILVQLKCTITKQNNFPLLLHDLLKGKRKIRSPFNHTNNQHMNSSTLAYK